MRPDMNEDNSIDGYRLALELMIRDKGLPAVLALLATVAAAIEDDDGRGTLLGMPIESINVND